jgi:hypothetical protein
MIRYKLNTTTSYGMDNGINPVLIKDLMNCSYEMAERIVKVLNKNETLKAIALKNYVAEPNPEGHLAHVEGSLYTKLVAEKKYAGYGMIDDDTIKAACVTAMAKVDAEVAKKETESAAEQAHYSELRKSGLCPKCGSWCYGDCEASK